MQGPNLGLAWLSFPLNSRSLGESLNLSWPVFRVLRSFLPAMRSQESLGIKCSVVPVPGFRECQSPSSPLKSPIPSSLAPVGKRAATTNTSGLPLNLSLLFAIK